jgi:hypothetical protein
MGISQTKAALQELFDLRTLRPDEARQRFGLRAEDVRGSASYGALSGLTELYQAETMPGRLYYAGDEFALLYVGKASQFQADDLQKALGEPAARLRTRAGKQFHHLVYPDKGVAFSRPIAGGTVSILEIFPPQSLDAYKTKYYQDPGSFKE